MASASAVTPMVAAAAEDAAPVTVIQETSDIRTGDVPVSQIRFTAELPAGFSGDVKAQMVIDNTPGGGWDTPSRMISGFRNVSCLVNGVPGSPCKFFGGTTEDDDGTLYLDLPTATVVPSASGQKVTWVLRMNVADNLFGSMGGRIDLRDAAGAALATAPVKINFVEGRASYRPTFFGRDAAGVLWQYESDGKTGSVRYAPRTRVGGGWNIYDTITRLGSSHVGSEAAPPGYGTELVARDAAGQLWFYERSGDPVNPFKSRKLVGGGWGQYTSIVGMGDSRRDGVSDLLARGSDGVLWFYRGTGNPDRPFKPRVKVGGGWNQYTSLTAFPNGLLAKDAAGVLWYFEANPTGEVAAPLKPRRQIGTGFGPFTALAYAGDKNALGHDDMLARGRDGSLWLYEGAWNTKGYKLSGKRTLVGGGWNIYNTLI